MDKIIHLSGLATVSNQLNLHFYMFTSTKLLRKDKIKHDRGTFFRKGAVLYLLYTGEMKLYVLTLGLILLKFYYVAEQVNIYYYITLKLCHEISSPM